MTAEQTSLTGGAVDIYVENKTTLTGAVIASDSGDLTLDTGSFEYSHIKDKDWMMRQLREGICRVLESKVFTVNSLR